MATSLPRNTGNNPGNPNAAGYYASATARPFVNIGNNPGNPNAAGYFNASTAPVPSTPTTAPVARTQPQGSAAAAGTNTLVNNPFRNFTTFAADIEIGLNRFTSDLNQAIGATIGRNQSSVLSLRAGIPALGGVITNAAAQANEVAAQLGSSINSIVAQVPAIGQIGTFANQLNGTLSGLTSGINNFTGSLSRATGGVAASLSRLPGPFNQLAGSVSNFNSNLLGGVSRLNNQLANVNSTLDNVSTLLTNPGQIIQDKINNLVGSGINKVMEPIRNLTSLGSQLAQQLSASTNFSTSSLSNLTGYVEGIFSGVPQLLNSAVQGSDFFQLLSGAVDLAGALSNITGIGPSVTTENGTKILNPLRQHNHYNYIITLGTLSRDQVNNPDILRASGFNQVILQSMGGSYGNRVQTYEEQQRGEHMEYFIEDLEIDSVVGLNPNTGVTTGTNIRFKVIEPYSMGKFLEAMILASQNETYDNYYTAPYGLKIDFVGWDEFGQRSEKYAQPPKFVPIQITKMDFDVTEQGSVYTIEAVSFPEGALSSTINQVLTPIEANGRFVHEVLLNSQQSVERAINTRVERLEERDIIEGYDRYIILFPTDKTALHNAIRGQGVNLDQPLTTAAEQTAIEQGLSTETAELSNPNSQSANADRFFSSPPQIYEFLKSWGANDSNINVIGKSPVFDDSRDSDKAAMPPAASFYDSEQRLFNRSYAEARVPSNVVNFNWPEGTPITKIIEDTLFESAYIKDAPSEDLGIPFKKWFRIETLTFIEENTEVESSVGRDRRTYVYAVHPYFPDEAKMIGTSEAPRQTEELKQSALKEYNYIYTGKNEDILDFSLNFNQAFFQIALGNFGQGPEDGSGNIVAPASTPASETAPTPSGSSAASEEGKPQIQHGLDLPLTRSAGGAEYAAGAPGVKRRIAEMVHETIINSPYNMVTAEMEIWGDPYFIPTDQGNYSAEPVGPSLTADGTMNYMQNEVLVVVNFRTPLDYPINGFVMDMPELVKPFSGLFQVWAVTNRFNDGKFTQILKLIRRPRQNDAGTGTQGAVVTSSDPNRVLETPPDLATSLGATGNLSGVGYSENGINQVDPRLAAAVYSQTGSFTDGLGNTVSVPTTTALPGSQIVSYTPFGDPITQAQAEAAVSLDAFGGSGIFRNTGNNPGNPNAPGYYRSTSSRPLSVLQPNNDASLRLSSGTGFA